MKQIRRRLTYASLFMSGLIYSSCSQTTGKSEMICNDVLYDVFRAKLSRDETIEQRDQRLITLYRQPHNLRNQAIRSIRERYRSQKSFNDAVLHNRTDIVRILSEIDAIIGRYNVNAVTNRGRTLLLEAVNNQNLFIARLLLEAGAGDSVNQPDNDGVTPLLAAIITGSNEMVERLLRHGANVNQPGGVIIDMHTRMLYHMPRHVIPPLSVAVQEGNQKIIKLLLGENGVDVNQVDHNGQTALHWAVKACNVEATELLLNKGAEIDCTDSKGNTPLLEASRNTVDPVKKSLMELLLKGGASANHVNNRGETALNRATIAVTNIKTFPEHYNNSDLAIFELLFKYGATVGINQQNTHGWLPLSASFYNHNQALAQLLIDKGADVHQANEINQTALYYAVNADNIEGVRLLLANGAASDVNRITRNLSATQCSPWSRALEKGNPAIIQLLRPYVMD